MQLQVNELRIKKEGLRLLFHFTFTYALSGSLSTGSDSM